MKGRQKSDLKAPTPNWLQVCHKCVCNIISLMQTSNALWCQYSISSKILTNIIHIYHNYRLGEISGEKMFLLDIKWRVVRLYVLDIYIYIYFKKISTTILVCLWRLSIILNIWWSGTRIFIYDKYSYQYLLRRIRRKQIILSKWNWSIEVTQLDILI